MVAWEGTVEPKHLGGYCSEMVNDHVYMDDQEK